MKKILTLAGIAAISLTGCHHNPNWHYDCDKYYSENSAVRAECDARVAQMRAAGHPSAMGPQGGGTVGLRTDITGPRSGEEIGHRTQDDL